MKKILLQYELTATGLVFSDGMEVMPLTSQLLEDNPTLYGPTGYLFQCLSCKKYHFYHDTD